MAKKNKDTNPDDIIRSVALFATSGDFLAKFAPTMEPKSIRQPEVQWVIKTVVNYYKDSRTAPTFDILRSLLVADDGVREEEKELVLPFLNEMETRKPRRKEYEYYADIFENYVQSSYLSFIVRQVTELVNDGNPEEAESRIKNSIMPRAVKTDIIFAPKDMALLFARKFDQDKGIPTGITELDARIGGLRSGELGVWLAPTGYGKSMALVVCGVAAYKAGFNVVHFTFENTEEETLKRYTTSMLGKTVERLADEGGIEGVSVLKFLEDGEQLGSQIAISRMIGSKTDASALLSNLYSILDVYNFDPNLIIVDYGDLMIPSHFGKDQYENMQTVFSELRDLSTELRIPVWTATQSNREGLKAKRVKLSHVSASLGKVMTADLVVGISRPEKDAAEEAGVELHDGDIAELSVLKFRRGEEGTAPIKVRTNFSLARLDELDATDTQQIAHDEKAKEVYRAKQAAKQAASQDD